MRIKLFISMFVLLLSPDVYAMSIACSRPPYELDYIKSNYVYSGEIVETENFDGPGSHSLSYKGNVQIIDSRVINIFKGDSLVVGEIMKEINHTSYGRLLESGEEVLFFVGKADGMLRSNDCPGNTRRINDVPSHSIAILKQMPALLSKEIDKISTAFDSEKHLDNAVYESHFVDDNILKVKVSRENDTPVRVVTYINDQQKTVKEFFANGQLKQETNYESLRPVGIERKYYKNGNLHSEMNHDKDRWHRTYRPDGSFIKTNRTEKNFTGMITTYGQDEAVLGEKKYKDGELLTAFRKDESGNTIFERDKKYDKNGNNIRDVRIQHVYSREGIFINTHKSEDYYEYDKKNRVVKTISSRNGRVSGFCNKTYKDNKPEKELCYDKNGKLTRELYCNTDRGKIQTWCKGK